MIYLKFKKLIKIIIIYTFYYIGFYKIINYIRKIIGKSSVAILLYHSFTDGKSNKFSLDSNLFEAQIKYLHSNYKIESLDFVLSEVSKKNKIKKNLVAITIDDGFLDNYEIAYPILKKYKVPVTIFLTSGLIREDDSIKDCHKLSQKKQNDSYRKKDCIDDNNVYKLPKLPMMTWKHIEEMVYNRIEFGAHTRYHPILTKISIDNAKKEIELSKNDIERHLSKKVKYFAYPNGLREDYNKKIVDIVKNAGFKASFVVNTGFIYNNDNLFTLNRIPIGNLSIPRFAAKINLIVTSL